MELTGDTPTDIKNNIEANKAAEQAIEKSVKILTSLSTLPAWHIGVISPGFLGLLWNAEKLGAHTYYGNFFGPLFVMTEVIFLFGIIACVFTYNHFNKWAMLMGLEAATIQEIWMGFENQERVGKLSRVGEKSLEDAIAYAKKLTDQRTNNRTPWYVDWSMTVYGYTALVGYVLMGIILLGFKM